MTHTELTSIRKQRNAIRDVIKQAERLLRRSDESPDFYTSREQKIERLLKDLEPLERQLLTAERKIDLSTCQPPQTSLRSGLGMMMIGTI